MQITLRLRQGVEIDVLSIKEIDEYSMNVEHYSPPESLNIVSTPITQLQLQLIREVETAFADYQIGSGAALSGRGPDNN